MAESLKRAPLAVCVVIDC